MKVDLKIIFWILLLFVIIAKALIEKYFKNYVAISNIAFPIAVAVLSSLIIFEYEFGRKQKFDEKKERIGTYNKLYEILRIANAHDLDNKNTPLEMTYSEIKELLKLVEKELKEITGAS